MTHPRTMSRHDPFPSRRSGPVIAVHTLQHDGASTALTSGNAPVSGHRAILELAGGSLCIEALESGALRITAEMHEPYPAPGEHPAAPAGPGQTAGKQASLTDAGQPPAGPGGTTPAPGGHPAAQANPAGPGQAGSTNTVRSTPRSYAVPEEPATRALRVSRDELGGVHVVSDALTLSLSADGRELRIIGTDDGFDRWRSSQPAFAWSRDRIGVAFELAGDDRVYGLGERMGFLDKRGKSYLNWNSDEPFMRENTDPLYQSIPVAVRFQPRRDPASPGSEASPSAEADVSRDPASPPVATGIFLDYPGASWFNIDSRAGGDSRADGALRIHQPEQYMCLYIFPGPGLDDVVEQYTALTGRIPMPPKWALGFHQCRYSYMSAERVHEIAEGFRNRDIPLDAIYLDIDYMDGYRVFTWNPQTFPDPAAMTAQLRERGIRVITIVDPGVKADTGYRVYREGLRDDAFARLSSGEVYHGEVWPGIAVFPDFTKETGREFWARHHESLLGAGVSGIWNDMNEPADFTGSEIDRTGFSPPLNLMLDGDGAPKGLAGYRNAYANGMAQATRQAFARHRPDERPFVLTRAGYAGIQRYAAVWNGDIDSSWHHLAQSVPMFLNMGLSGVPFVGNDIGGFQYNATPELYIRWMQFACFSPYTRAHTAVDTRDHEPWSFGPRAADIAAETIRRRYRYLPYLYSVFRECALTGAPIMRSLVSAFPDDPRVHGMWDQYLFGPSLLVCPVLSPDVRKRHVYLPEGLWVDIHTHAEYSGPCDIVADAPLDRIPVFVRAPAVIPMQAPAAHTGVPVDRVELHAFPGGVGGNPAGRQGGGQDVSAGIAAAAVPGADLHGGGRRTTAAAGEAVFELYDDDGTSFAAEREGEYRLLRLTLASGERATLSIEPVHDKYAEAPGNLAVIRSGKVIREIASRDLPAEVEL